MKLEQDDAINVHDRFTVAKRIAPRTLQVVLERGARYFRPGNGNTVELLDPGYNATGWKGKCVGTDGETIQVDRDLPASDPEEGYFLVFDRTASSDGVIIRNCTFEDMEMRTLVNGSHRSPAVQPGPVCRPLCFVGEKKKKERISSETKRPKPR